MCVRRVPAACTDGVRHVLPLPPPALSPEEPKNVISQVGRQPLKVSVPGVTGDLAPGPYPQFLNHLEDPNGTAQNADAWREAGETRCCVLHLRSPPWTRVPLQPTANMKAARKVKEKTRGRSCSLGPDLSAPTLQTGSGSNCDPVQRSMPIATKTCG